MDVRIFMQMIILILIVLVMNENAKYQYKKGRYDMLHELVNQQQAQNRLEGKK